MHSIGDFSRLTQVPVKTLRYYDDIGLLSAMRVPRSGARVYTATHVERLNRILVLKELGLPLVRIRALLAADVSPNESVEVLRERRDEMRRDVEQAKRRLERAEARLALLERHEALAARDVAVRTTSAWRLVSVRDRLASYDEAARLFDELDHALGARRPRAQRGAIWHECADGVIDCEAFELLASPVPVRGRARLRELPPRRIASLVYHGDHDYLPAFRAVREWFAACALEAPSAKIELYLAEGGGGAESVTELQFTVGRCVA